MKMTRLLSTALLFLLPGAIATVYAQEHEQEKNPEQKQEQAKPAQRQQKAKPAKPAKQEAAREQKAQPAKQPERAASEQKAKPAKQEAAREQPAKPAEHQQRGGQQAQASRGQASGGGHGSIPEAKFRASFGSGHTFHVNRSQWAGGSARFQYGGYWFNAVNPWPVGWLFTDEVYVDFLNGGYFLCDPLHPGVYISINIG